jgi:hypothetical protein
MNKVTFLFIKIKTKIFQDFNNIFTVLFYDFLWNFSSASTHKL